MISRATMLHCVAKAARRPAAAECAGMILSLIVSLHGSVRAMVGDIYAVFNMQLPRISQLT